ncbi:hypothetical protein PSAB6_420101 [Paraburkholderia sabiae]|nr:hypothetical protein PSAB6_420101 [Paraburkholderia sabiae]
MYGRCYAVVNGFFVCDAVAISVFGFLVFFWFFGFGCGGIREFVSVLQASPLCGAAPTFLCSGKEK